MTQYIFIQYEAYRNFKSNQPIFRQRIVHVYDAKGK